MEFSGWRPDTAAVSRDSPRPTKRDLRVLAFENTTKIQREDREGTKRAKFRAVWRKGGPQGERGRSCARGEPEGPTPTNTNTQHPTQHNTTQKNKSGFTLAQTKMASSGTGLQRFWSKAVTTPLDPPLPDPLRRLRNFALLFPLPTLFLFVLQFPRSFVELRLVYANLHH